jgi:fimbrial chaperone protein
MFVNSFRAGVFKAIAVLAFSAQAGMAVGSVVLPNTRVIYDGNAPERSLQFSNPDDGPSVMQVWIDSGDEQSTPKTADAPFVVTPPIFRIEAKGGQMVRLVYTGKDLPQDRETVFYLNTLQVPSVNATYADENQMLVMLRNRIKLFYRPSGLPDSAQNAPEKLSFSVAREGKGARVSAKNASSYFVSLVDGSLVCGSHTATFEPDMVAPRGEATWNLKGNCPLDGSAVRVKVHYVDDFGAVRASEYPAAVSGAK